MRIRKSLPRAAKKKAPQLDSLQILTPVKLNFRLVMATFTVNSATNIHSKRTYIATNAINALQK